MAEQVDGFECLSGEHVERREEGQNEAYGAEEGEHGMEDCLSKKLLDQVGPPGPNHLAQAYLAGPLGGAGRCEVHEVDAGDQQDKKGDDRINDDISDGAIPFDPVEMKPRQGKEDDLGTETGDVIGDDFFDLGIQGQGISAFGQPDVSG